MTLNNIPIPFLSFSLRKYLQYGVDSFNKFITPERGFF